jgi:hypothetical protein
MLTRTALLSTGFTTGLVYFFMVITPFRWGVSGQRRNAHPGAHPQQ